jgi:hypothetical protein
MHTEDPSARLLGSNQGMGQTLDLGKPKSCWRPRMVGGIDCGKLLPCSDRWIPYETDVPKHQLSGIYLQSSRGQGRIIGYFVEHSPDAGSYTGELLGLMAIHLVLRGVHEFSLAIGGSVQIISDCMGALNKVENMPPYQIPTKCSHPDIKRNYDQLRGAILQEKVFACSGAPRQWEGLWRA